MSQRFKESIQKEVWNDHARIGNGQIEEGHIEQACQYYQKAVALNPEDVEAHRNLAVALRQKGDMGSAVKHLKQALHLQKRPDSQFYKQSRIFYFCPDLVVKSGGVRRLYRHVDILVRNGFPAAILHAKKDFFLPDQPCVPVRYLENQGELKKNDIVVIPEGFPEVMLKLKDLSIRRFVIALSWSYIFSTLPDRMDWRDFNIERVLVVCPFIGDMISWSMGLPVHLIDYAINSNLYHYRPETKKLKIAYIRHKAQNIEAFQRLLRAKNADYVDKFDWTALGDLSEEEYAAQIRESWIFLNLSNAEGLLTSCLEAMSAGCVLAGYNSVGGKDLLEGQGNRQNCILAQNGDYVSLAHQIAPLLSDLLEGKNDRWEIVIQNGINLGSTHTTSSEETSVIDFWRTIQPVVAESANATTTVGGKDVSAIGDSTALFKTYKTELTDRAKNPRELDALFADWFEKMCIPGILDIARQRPLIWQERALEWEVCHEILAYHHFCEGNYSVDELISLSNNRFKLLDSIWPGNSPSREELDRFYLESAKILPWGHGVFPADHNKNTRRSDWLRRVEFLLILKNLGVDSIADFGAGGGHTSLMAKALGFSRVIHHEYSIFHPFVVWRAVQMACHHVAGPECQFVASDASSALVLAEPVQAVICNDVAEHVYDPEAMLKEIGDSLEIGGYLIWVSVFGEGISCHLHGHLHGKEDQLLERHGFYRVSELPVKYEGHSGIYQLRSNSKCKARSKVALETQSVPSTIFTQTTDLYMASADRMDHVLKNLSQIRTDNPRKIDAYATVIGGLSGLNYLLEIEPANVAFFDLNPAAVGYARLILEIISMSENHRDFIGRIFCRSVDEFINETGNSDLTYENQAHYIARPPDQNILKQTLKHLSRTGSEIYKTFVTPYHSGRTLDGIRNCRRLLPCYPIDEFVPVGGGKDSEYDRSGHLVPNTNTFFYGYGWLASKNSFQQIKRSLINARISYLHFDLLKEDLSGLINPAGSNIIHVSNIDDWFPRDWEQRVQHWHSIVTSTQGQLAMITSHNGVFRLKIDPHQYAYQAIAPFVFGDTIEVTHKIPWGFNEIERTNLSVEQFLSSDCRAHSIILHILVGEGLDKTTFKAVLLQAMKNGRRIIVLEHNHDSADWQNHACQHFFSWEKLRRLLEKTADELSWKVCTEKTIAGEKDDKRNMMFVIDADRGFVVENERSEGTEQIN